MKLAAKIFTLLMIVSSIGFAQDPPTGLTVVSVLSTSAQVSWGGGAVRDKFDIQLIPGSLRENVHSPHTFDNLYPNTLYSWQVRTTKGNKESGWVSGPSFTTTPAAPSTPAGLSASPTATGASLSWGSVSGATSYAVEVHDKSNYSSLVQSATSSTNSASLSGLQSGMPYYWQVKAVNAGGSSEWARGTFTTLEPTPDPPSNLQVSNVSSSSATLSWSGGGQGTKIELQVSPGNISDDNASSPRSLSSLTASTAYTWKVRAVKGSQSSAWVDGPAFTTSGAPPTAPTGLSATPTTTGASLNWSAVTGATSYVVEVHDKSNYNSLVTSTTATGSSATITGLQGGTKYYWRVKAVNAGGESGWGEGSFTTTTAAPSTPAGLSASPATTGASLSWGSVSGATSYAVEVHDKQNYNSLVKSTTASGNSATISGLQGGTTYYWRVKAVGAGGESGWGTASFATTASPSPPTVTVTPAITSVSITFTTVSGASQYDVQILDKQNNGNVISSGLTTKASTPVTITNLTSKTKYYYEATVTVGSVTSAPAKGDFTTADAPEVTLTVTPSSATFTFKSVTGATKYDLKVLDKQNNGSIVGTGSVTNAATPVLITGLQSKTKYYYEATVTVGGVASDPAKGDFTTADAPTVQAPEVTLTVTPSSATFTFKTVTGATKYDLKVLDKQNNGSIVGTGSVTNAATPVLITGLQSKTKYYYEATVTVGGVTSDPAKGDFTTADAPTVQAPEVTLTVTSSSASFTFKTVTGATKYDLKVLDKQNNGSIVGTGSVTNAATPVSITGLTSKTKYYYEATVTVGGVTSDPAKGDFTTADASTVQAPEVTLTVTSNSATFAFKTVTGATKYDLKVLDKQNNGSIVGTGSVTNAATPVSITGLTSKTKYYYEATVTVGGQTSEPTKGNFTTDEASSSVSPPEVSVATTSSSATFTFKAVTGATLYEVKLYDKQNNGTLQGSGSTTDAARAATISGLRSKEKYYYEATVTVGGVTSDPAKGDFTTADAPTVQAPEVTLTVTSSSATFTFKAVTGATKYDLNVLDKQNNGTIVGGGSITDPATPVLITGLQSKTKYYYEAMVTVGGVTSDPAKGDFTTADASTVTLVAPSNLQVTNITSVSASLSWDGPGQGAKFELKVSPGNISEANANSPYSLGSLSPKTSYTWQIRTVKNNDSSAWVSGPSFTTLDASTGTLVAPSNLQVTNITSVSASLSWDGPGQGAKFELKVSPGNISEANANSPYSLGSLSVKTSYTWQIRTVKNNDSSAWVSGPSFTTLDASTGTLVAPSNLQVTNITSVSASLSWDGPGQGTKFDVKLSPGNLLFSNLNSSPLSASPLSPNTTYTWQVRSTRINDSSAWISGASFTTAALTTTAPLAPTLSSPANNVTGVSTSPTFTWSTPTGATSYTLQVSTSSGFSTFVFNQNTLTSPSYTLAGLSNSTQYYWRVSASNAGGSSPFSGTSSFTTILALPGAPSGLAASPTPTGAVLTWTAASGATWYFVEVYDANFTVVWKDSVSSLTSTARNLLSATSYTWRVQGANAAGRGTWISGAFRTPIAVPAAPGNLTASPNATGASLSWAAVSGAASYVIEVYTDNNLTTRVWKDSLTTPPATVSNLLSGRSYTWRIQATNAGGASGWTMSSFATTAAPPMQPTLLSPANGALGIQITVSLSWNAVTGATTYRLQVSASQTFATFIVDDAALTATSRQVGPLSNNTQYYWRVSATNAAGTSSYSATYSFTTVVAAPSTPTLSLPANGSTNVPINPSLSWNAATSASTYRLQVSASQTFVTSIVDDAALTATSRQVGPLSNNAEYYWRVSATNAAGTSAFSGTYSFRTLLPVPVAPTLSSPADSAINVPRTVSLSWNAAATATSYRVQIATTASFTSRILDTANVTGLGITVSLNLNTKYYWRVSAVNASGEGAFSPARSFTVVQPTAVERTGSSIPSEFSLGQNYPNPFNPSTKIEFSIPTSGHVRVQIFNSLGIQISTLVDGLYSPGRYLVSWEASSFPSGVYFYRLQTPGFAATKRLMLLK